MNPAAVVPRFRSRSSLVLRFEGVGRSVVASSSKAIPRVVDDVIKEVGILAIRQGTTAQRID